MNKQDTGFDDFTLRTGISADDFYRLGRLPMFAGLEPQKLQDLLSSSSVRRYPNGTTLFMEGEVADRSFVVLEGWVKLYRLLESGNEVVISVASPGESFAEAALFDGNVFPVNATAITDARLLVVSGDSLIRQIRANPDFAISMLGSMSRHLRTNVTRLHNMCSMSTTERLADFLVGLSPVMEGSATIELPLDKSLIAARLGMQPETFSRALAKLKESGVTSAGHNIKVADMSAVRKLVKNRAMGCS